MAASYLVDAKVRLLPGAPAPLIDLARVRFHQGTSEILARVKLLSKRELAPGGEAFAQIRLEGAGTSLPGDRFILRRYSPATTIGGGIVLSAHPPKHKGAADPALLDRLSRLEAAAPSEALRIYIEGEPAGMELGRLGWTAGRTPEEVESMLRGSFENGDVLRAGSGGSSVALSRRAVEALEGSLMDALERYHQANPLRPGMPLEELREKASKEAGAEVSRVVIDRLARSGRVKAERDTISLASHEVILSPEDEGLMRTLEDAFLTEGLEPPTLEGLIQSRGLDGPRAARVLHLLLASGRLVRIRDGKVFHSRAIQGLKEMLWSLPPGQRVIDIGRFKEMTGTSRKNAIPLLEHLDSLRVTRRIGSDREILPPQTS
jgi:selenocysteine-specific elongation factor